MLVAGEDAKHISGMVKVNCGAIPRELFESEFFGHVKGAFTGAVNDRVGRFQLADRGTLFLDEVAEIPLELQSKLLRVLQEGTFERIGEGRTREVNVRTIAATNQDLEKRVASGHFREDLYYRLNVFPIVIAPLRDRTEDIPALAADCIDKSCRRLGVPTLKLTRGQMAMLQSYDWPGKLFLSGRLVQVAARCPVHKTLTNGVHISDSVVFE